MTDAPLLPEEETLAAEYVLGVGDAASRAAAEARMRRDPAFAAMVADWENRLSGLNDGFGSGMSPPADLLPRIEARLFPAPARPALWRRRRFFGGMLAGTAAALAITILPPLLAPSAPMERVAELSADGSPVRFEVAWYADGMMRATRMAGSAAPLGQSHELWMIGTDGVPHSLGLIADGPMEKPMPEGLPMGVTLAVTMEPAGGAPGGVPTGPMVAKGIVRNA